MTGPPAEVVNPVEPPQIRVADRLRAVLAPPPLISSVLGATAREALRRRRLAAAPPAELGMRLGLATGGAHPSLNVAKSVGDWLLHVGRMTSGCDSPVEVALDEAENASVFRAQRLT